MQDVAYRINNALPVKTKGTVVTNQVGSSLYGTYFVENTFTQTVPNETVSGTGLVDRFDDRTYYG